MTEPKCYSFYSESGNGFGYYILYTLDSQNVEYIVKVVDDTAGSGNSQVYYFSVNGEYPLKEEMDDWDYAGGSADAMDISSFLSDGWLLRKEAIA